MRQIVIIGNGIAGITAARHIRQRSLAGEAEDRITVISSETDHFYSRTALMYLYMGHMEYHHLKPYEDWFWPKNRIELLRAHVTAVDFAKKTLRTTGPDVAYDVLILALGSVPNKAGWPGQDLPGVQGLYGMPDLETLEASTRTARRAVVVGGGLIGIELCEMLLSRRIPVTFLIREKSFWRSVLPEEESALVTRHIREHGVELRTETELAELLDNGSGRVGAVRTKAGETIPADVVGLAVGVSPNIGWLGETALDTDRGILVNEYLETNLPGVYAIGDCVQHRQPPVGPGGARRKPLEQIWYTGRIMGETVAQTITGTRTAYNPGVFFNSAKFFDIEYQTYGDVANFLPSAGPEQTFYWEHPGGRKALRINYRTDTGAVTGVNALGIRQRQAVWERWITDRQPIRYVLEHLAEANFDPEFYEQHETDILAQFNAQNPGAGLVPNAKKGLFSRLFS